MKHRPISQAKSCYSVSRRQTGVSLDRWYWMFSNWQHTLPWISWFPLPCRKWDLPGSSEGETRHHQSSSFSAQWDTSDRGSCWGPFLQVGSCAAVWWPGRRGRTSGAESAYGGHNLAQHQHWGRTSPVVPGLGSPEENQPNNTNRLATHY